MKMSWRDLMHRGCEIFKASPLVDRPTRRDRSMRWKLRLSDVRTCGVGRGVWGVFEGGVVGVWGLAGGNGRREERDRKDTWGFADASQYTNTRISLSLALG